MRRAAALVALCAALAAVLAAPALHAEPVARGSGEIDYERLTATFVRPGESVAQAVDVQAPGLTGISFLYSSPGGGGGAGERVRVTVRGAGTAVADREVSLPSTPDQSDPAFWWAGGYWGVGARFEAVPARGRSGERLLVAIGVERSSRPLALWRSRPDGRLAVRTEYGPVRPAIEKAPVFVGRVASTGAPWLPAPALWLLAALLVAVTACLAWAVAGGPGDGDA